MKTKEFKCTSNQFTTPFVSSKTASYEESKGIFCQLSKKTGRAFGEVRAALARLAAVAGRMFHSEVLGWLL